jgi:PTH2 family peptidyl-tRNA hydrolase
VFLDRKLDMRVDDILVIPLTTAMAEWVRESHPKIVLGVNSEADLFQALKAAEAAGLPTAMITDLGFTEFHGEPTNTAVAIGPARTEEIDVITGPTGLIKCRLL